MAKSIFKVLQDGKIIEYQFYPYDLKFQAPSKGGSFYLDYTMDSDTFGNIKIMSTKDDVDISYTVVSNNSWINVSGNKIALNENNETVSRNGSITLTQSETDDKMDIFFIQEPAELEYVFTTENGTTVYDLSVPASAQTANFVLVSYMGSPKNTIGDIRHQAVSTLPSWVNAINQLDAVINDNGRVRYLVSMEPNSTKLNRLANITFTQVGSGKEVYVSITQLPNQESTNINFTVSYNIQFINNSSKQGFRRFYLQLIGGETTTMFSILGGNTPPGSTFTESSSSTTVMADTSYTATQGGIISSSGLREEYKIYCNNQLIIDAVIPSQTPSVNAKIVQLKTTVPVKRDGNYFFTGTVTFYN